MLKTEHKTLPKDQSQVKNYEETCNTYGCIRPTMETLISMLLKKLLDLNALSAAEGHLRALTLITVHCHICRGSPQVFNSTLSDSLKVPMQTKGVLPFDFFKISCSRVNSATMMSSEYIS